MKKLISSTLAAIMIATTLVGSTCYANEDVIASNGTDTEQQIAICVENRICTEKLARRRAAVTANALEAAMPELKTQHEAVLATLKAELKAQREAVLATLKAELADIDALCEIARMKKDGKLTAEVHRVETSTVPTEAGAAPFLRRLEIAAQKVVESAAHATLVGLTAVRILGLWRGRVNILL